METSLLFELPTSEATIEFGRALGFAVTAALEAQIPLRTILMFGDLGSGKTTLTRGLVEVLPGGDQAEVCSPSFTVCNEYPTKPTVVHCDLYRDENADGLAAGLPNEAWDAWERDNNTLVLVEWAQRLREKEMPASRLDILMKSCNDKHSAVLIPHGEAALFVAGAMRHRA